MLATLAVGCTANTATEHTPRSPTTAQQKPPAAPLHHGPLTDYVPAAGLRWMVVGQPEALFRNKALSTAAGALLTPQRVRGFRQSTGVDLRSAPHALVAGFDLATLYSVETKSTDAVSQAFEGRLLSKARDSTPHPSIRKVSGIVAGTPETLVSVDKRFIAVAVGDPTYARVVQAFAEKKLKKSPSALRGAALRTLPEWIADAPIGFFAPGPFSGQWTAGARGLLRAALAVGAALEPDKSGKLRATLVLAGGWDELDVSPEAELLTAWKELAGSTTGVLFGLDRPARSPVVSRDRDLLKLVVVLDYPEIIRGLSAAVNGSIRDILDIRPAGSDSTDKGSESPLGPKPTDGTGPKLPE